MEIRELTNNNQNYFEINREERNYAAIFFTALCKEGNVKKFLKLCNIDSPIRDDEFGIYFEYSFLRDLWYSIGKSEKKTETDEGKEKYLMRTNNIKKDIIRNKLQIKNIEEILNKSTKDINNYFGVGGEASEEYIQYPGKWAITKFADKFQNNEEDFLNVCKFKWSFNIKPDIVIHLSKDRAICIEAKYESGEGEYPSSFKDIEKYDAIVKNRKPHKVSQTELQYYMMKELLDLEINKEKDFIALVQKNIVSTTHKNILWSEAFGCLDLSGLPPFAIKMIQNTNFS